MEVLELVDVEVVVVEVQELIFIVSRNLILSGKLIPSGVFRRKPDL